MRVEIFLGALLLSLAGNADAHWMRVMTSEGSEIFLDVKSIQRDGATVRAWNLENFSRVRVSAEGRPYTSSLVRSEYDCENNIQRQLSSIWYSGKMGRGEVAVTSARPGEWQASMPATVAGVLHLVACRER